MSTEQVNKKKKKWRSLHTPITGKKKKLAELTLDLLLSFYFNRYSSGVYNRPYEIYIQDLTGLRQLNTIIFKNQNQGGQFRANDFS
jgi:hypothetical protein